MTTAHIEGQNLVFKSVANVLKHLSVEKNGVLPGNMGGKPYISAVDISAEVKRQFVENNLILAPQETVVAHENMFHNNRLQVSIVVLGTYTIIHTEDGSSITVSGTGDGLATGTAVASNIASTNALKNALLRTFLITEQSVEDASKAEIDTSATPAQRAVDNARKTPARAAAKPATKSEEKVANVASKSISNAKEKIRKEWIDTGKVDMATIQRMQEEVKAEGVTGGAKLMEAVLKRLEAGEVS